MSKIVSFKQIPTEYSQRTHDNIEDLVNKITDGFKIISAAGAANSVQYVLVKEEPKPPKKKDK